MSGDLADVSQLVPKRDLLRLLRSPVEAEAAGLSRAQARLLGSVVPAARLEERPPAALAGRAGDAASLAGMVQ